MRIGLLGGTFDPVHIGHLVMAEEARLRMGLERVLFIPAGAQWMKTAGEISPSDARAEMVRAAIADNPAFELSLVDVERPGPTYSVDTLRLLRDQLGQATELFFILGQDALEQMPEWHLPREMLRLCTLVVMPRPGVPPLDWDALERRLLGVRERSRFLGDAPQVQVSATEVRRRITAGESVRYLVPEAVLEVIRRRGLYRN
ncbi:MAG: nicotinate-nucleotide adenylyltransferase [Chloroflexi bacterium]|nr:nicotinate-nucleotide adenylyltransferase [Chloroflexota bacterium]